MSCRSYSSRNCCGVGSPRQFMYSLVTIEASNPDNTERPEVSNCRRTKHDSEYLLEVRTSGSQMSLQSLHRLSGTKACKLHPQAQGQQKLQCPKCNESSNSLMLDAAEAYQHVPVTELTEYKGSSLKATPKSCKHLERYSRLLSSRHPHSAVCGIFPISRSFKARELSTPGIQNPGQGTQSHCQLCTLQNPRATLRPSGHSLQRLNKEQGLWGVPISCTKVRLA